MAVKISIVIPTYNRPALLKRCLEMLAIQVFPKDEYEVIVISDGPDMETRKIVYEIRHNCRDHPSIKYDFLPVKKGPAAARNKGWKAAEGSLIAFTDDDCIPSIYWLHSIWNSYRQQEEIVFTGKVIVPRPLRPTDHEQNTSRLETAEFVTANCFCTRKALEKVNGFDERFSAAWREDSDLQFRLLGQHIPVQPIEEAFIIHPVRQARWGISLKEQRKSMFNALLYKKHPHLYRKQIQAKPPWLYYTIVFSFILFWIGFLAMKSFFLSVLALLIWVSLSCWFIFKRLSGNSHKILHISEMIVTSLFIPFLSVFWRLYGSYKFKVLFL